MSQEKLAEKIGVSRQAITKWETNAGIPDIENMMALSSLFDVTIDELLSAEKSTKQQPDYLYESVTEYDIDCPKRYDMKLGGAKHLKLSGYDGEKIRIRLASNTLQTLSSDFKLKIDDVKNRIDIDLSAKTAPQRLWQRKPSAFSSKSRRPTSDLLNAGSIRRRLRYPLWSVKTLSWNSRRQMSFWKMWSERWKWTAILT